MLISTIIPIFFPVFIPVLIGFVWCKQAIPFDKGFVTRIVMNVGAPCLVVSSISNLQVSAAEFGQMLLAACLLLVSLAVVGAVILRLCGQSLRVYLPSIVFGNTGNMGLPICLFAFGSEGLGLAAAVFLVSAAGQFTILPLLQSERGVLKTLITTPLIYAATVAILLIVGGVELPLWLGNSVSLLGSVAIPLMLISLGYSLASLSAHSPKVAIGLAALRLLLGFSIGLGIATLLGLEGVKKGVVVIQASMPTAVFVYLMASRYRQQPDNVAGIVVASTIMAFIALPIVLPFVIAF